METHFCTDAQHSPSIDAHVQPSSGSVNGELTYEAYTYTLQTRRWTRVETCWTTAYPSFDFLSRHEAVVRIMGIEMDLQGIRHNLVEDDDWW